MFWRSGRKTPSSRRRALVVLPIWICSLLWMWTWWLNASHIVLLPLYIALSFAMLYEFALLPSVFLYFVLRAKRPEPVSAPANKRVAVISLCVPSMESSDIVENQLRAMSQITYPHDSWILDEGNNPKIKQLAKKYGVRHFSRVGINKYNQPIPPYQAKTKAGNVNAWLDKVKRLGLDYEFFVQLDIDHIPKPVYLDKTLGYFADPHVGWVQAPSVYKNLGSWTARGAAEQELVLQGPLQMGFYGHSRTPFIIGSHCTYRMSAIREIGGFQPTRAEDHLDTVYLANKGYTGVFLPEIIAEGDGPETLNTYLAQQFAWAYSMFQVLLSHTPKLIGAMPWQRKWQFLFAQTWYPLWSLSYFIMFVSPVLALVANHNIVDVDPFDTLIHFVPTYSCGFMVWWAGRALMQPRGLRLTWRGVLLHAVRWPIIMRALFASLFKIKKPYMITPKGEFAKMAPMLATYRPFLFFGALSSSAVILAFSLREGSIPEAQAVYAIVNALFMFAVCVVDLSLRLSQVKPRFAELREHWVRPLSATMALALIISLSIVVISVTSQYGFVFAQPETQSVSTPIYMPADYAMSTSELVRQIALVPINQGKLPNLGIYSATSSTSISEAPYIEHSFVDWQDEHYLAYVLATSLQSGKTPLITLEPRGETDGAKLLKEIAGGGFDERLYKIAAIIRHSKNPVYVRFAHEMELGDLYPWSNQDSSNYIQAYRHVVDYFKVAGVNNIRFVWSPAGNFGAGNYYPGDTYVDVIGATILYDQYWYGQNLPSFSYLAKDRQW